MHSSCDKSHLVIMPYHSISKGRNTYADNRESPAPVGVLFCPNSHPILGETAPLHKVPRESTSLFTPETGQFSFEACKCAML